MSNVSQTYAPNMIGDAFGGGASRMNIEVPVRIQLGTAVSALSISTGSSPISASGVVPIQILVNGQAVDLSAVEDLRTEFYMYPAEGSIPSTVAADVLLDSGLSAADVSEGADLPVQDPSVTSGYDVASEEAYIRSEIEPYGYDFSYEFLSSSHVHVTPTAGSPEGIANLDYVVTLLGPDIILPNPSAGGTVGRVKIAENTSPLPRDRFIFDYSLFYNVPLYVDFPVNRFTPGFEKTFFNGTTSIEMRFPMAITLPQSVDLQSDLSYTALYEFGNVSVTPKLLVLQQQTWAFSIGMSIFLPTASDLKVTWYDGTRIIDVENQSVNLAPFLGFLWVPNGRFYLQSFLQYSIDTNGCPVSVNLFTTDEVFLGRIYDGTHQYLDIAGGFWVFENPDATAPIRRIAWQNEVHWNYSLQPPKMARASDITIGRPDARMNQWNLTTGLVAELRNNWSVALALALPLNSSFREYDGELRLAVNKFFGSGSSAL